MKICTCVCQFGSAKVVIIIGKIKKKIEYYDIPNTTYDVRNIIILTLQLLLKISPPYFFRIDLV